MLEISKLSLNLLALLLVIMEVLLLELQHLFKFLLLESEFVLLILQ